MVPPLTVAQAAGLHRASLLATCELLRNIDGMRSVLVAAPDEAAPQLARSLGPLIDDHWPQGDGTLGARLVRAAARAFAEGASVVLLFGADSPTMPLAYINEAIGSLEHHSAVMGPCDDGGYYLLGLAAPQPALFDGIDWGSACVAEQTRVRARSADIDLFELPGWHDIDRWDDLPRATKALGDYDDLGPQRRALKQEIDRLLRHEPGDGT